MKRKLTQRLIDNMPTPERGELCYYDSEVTGLLCRARSNGSKAWMPRFKVAGRERKFSIGNAKIGKLDSAREVAKQHLWSVATGEDPLEQARLSKALKSMTVTDLGEEVLDHLAAQGRSAKYIADYRRLLTKVIHPAIGDQGVKEVTTRDLDRLVRRMATTPRTGNVLRSLLSRMFILAVTWGYRPDNPALGIEKFSERARERVLTDEELDCLISALDASPSQTSADVVRLLLFTGSRGGEVLGATWGQFQLEEGVWIKPSQHTKTKRAHRVELGPDALLVLRRMELAKGHLLALPVPLRLPLWPSDHHRHVLAPPDAPCWPGGDTRARPAPHGPHEALGAGYRMA